MRTPIRRLASGNARTAAIRPAALIVRSVLATRPAPPGRITSRGVDHLPRRERPCDRRIRRHLVDPDGDCAIGGNRPQEGDVAQFIVQAVTVYAAIGGVLAMAFLLWGIDRIDPAAAGAYAFRALLLPGAVLLWPVVALRWVALERRR